MIAYGYDELGRLLSRSFQGASNRVTYDSLGRIHTATNLLGALPYNFVGVTERLDNVLYPNGQRTNYVYFANSGDKRLQRIQNLTLASSNLSKFNDIGVSLEDVACLHRPNTKKT